MELTITVLYLDSPARYGISRENNGIYAARLLAYDGPDGITPPGQLTLVRGVRSWIGSCDEPWFVASIGRALEAAVAEAITPQPIHPQ